MTIPRIALIHFHLESNRAAPVTTREEFAAQRLMIGPDYAAAIGQNLSRASGGTRGFIAEFGEMTPVPVFAASAGAGGMIDGPFFQSLLNAVRTHLPSDVDGVYLDAHGACISTDDEDPDGTMIACIRAVVGPDVPIVTTLDLHGHVSPAMIEGADFLAAYRTNPHVDQYERGQEAARALKRLMAGEKTHRALVRLPFIPPSTTLGTDRGPYGRLMERAVAAATGPVWNVSLCSGFSVGDSTKAGVNVTVTASDPDSARATAQDIAAQFWAARDEFQIALTSIEDAVALMADSPEPLIYGDVADNPGGGGRGNTLALLQAMLDAQVPNALVGMVYDPELAAEATELSEGAEFEARFNRSETEPSSGHLTTRARVLKTVDGPVACRRGLYAGGQQNLGPCVLLDCGGVRVIVSTIRRQLCEPAFVERFGLDIDAFSTIVVKSRGHFRAGFDEFFPPERVIEVDGPGLTTPVLSRLDLSHTPRPIVPLD